MRSAAFAERGTIRNFSEAGDLVIGCCVVGHTVNFQVGGIVAPASIRPRAAGAINSCWKSPIGFHTPKLREVDTKSKKILVKKKPL